MALKCPECGNEHLHWFLRSDIEGETDANTITILCPFEYEDKETGEIFRGCGNNASIHLEELLEYAFPEWLNDQERESLLGSFMRGLQAGQSIEEAMPAGLLEEMANMLPAESELPA